VIAQVALAEAAGIRDLVGMDIGGTSTDVSVVQGGVPHMKSEFEVEFGTVVGFPMIDINSIGAGGGTVAWLDQGGMLHSGPRSAGADPGPACYQRGGTEPTVTDAHVVVGRLNPEHLLGGRMPIDAEAARNAVAALGDECGLDPEAMAAGILTLTVSNVAAATRQLTVERGINPRDLALMAYGGGGPLLGCDVAAELEIPTVIVPPSPGLTSALGLLLTDIRHDFVRTFLTVDADCTAAEVAAAFDELVAQGDAALAAEGIEPERRVHTLSADLRYVGQTHELAATLGSRYDDALHAELGERLRVEHLAQYGYAPDGGQQVEIVNLRVAAQGLMDRPQVPSLEGGPPVEPVATRRLFHGGEWHDASVFRRADLPAGMTFAGPAIVDQPDSTTVVLPGWTATVHPQGSMLLRVGGVA
jgi:N-methylhydantoinase A